jgi:putative endonuclease
MVRQRRTVDGAGGDSPAQDWPCTMQPMELYYIFILASRHHRHVTVDVCAELSMGVNACREQINRQLGKRRVLQNLVYVESVQGMTEAVRRVRQIQTMQRRELDQLVESVNPGWDRISLKYLASSGFTRRPRLH